MQELMEMRALMETGRYADALVLLGEMDEMAKDDKINKLESYLHIVLLHLIKQQAEERNTRLWSHAIRQAIYGARRCLIERQTGRFYLTEVEIQDAIAEIFDCALGSASLEVFEGMLSERKLLTLINPAQVQAEALRRVISPQKDDDNLDFDLPQWLK